MSPRVILLALPIVGGFLVGWAVGGVVGREAVALRPRAFLGLDDLSHYAVASVSAHDRTMNLTIGSSRDRGHGSDRDGSFILRLLRRTPSSPHRSMAS
jgi:hypothetical protein